MGKTDYTMALIADGKSPRVFETETQALTGQDHIEVRLLPYGSSIAVLTPTR